MAAKRSGTKMDPSRTPGFGWRVSLSILLFFVVFAFVVIWLFFYSGNYNIYQNAAIIILVVLSFFAVMAASWAPWGMKYARKAKHAGNIHEHICEHTHRHGSGSAVYGLGFIGALVYYLITATSFWMAIIGFLKAIVWPAFLVFGLMKFLGM